MPTLLVLSHVQARSLISAHAKGAAALEISPDLGLTTVTAAIGPEGARFPAGELLSWEAAEEISASDSNCYVYQDGAWNKILFYSEDTSRVYSLYPTRGAPTMLISGLPMHRIKDTDPAADTHEKVKTIRPVVGQVLDTATGLGYTAIEASRTAEHVTTIELDPAALQVARLNPWSQALFENSKITRLTGDSFDVVETMEAARFSRVIHDPPVFSLASHLYSVDFYRELLRVMRNRARLFHYIGNPDSKSGHNITASVVRHLKEAGFVKVEHHPKAFGVTALKPSY